MGTITMGMGTITINNHKATRQFCPWNPLSGHEKAMLSYNVSMAFFVFVWEGILLSHHLLSLMSTLSVVNMLQVIPFAIEAEDISLA